MKKSSCYLSFLSLIVFSVSSLAYAGPWDDFFLKLFRSSFKDPVILQIILKSDHIDDYRKLAMLFQAEKMDTYVQGEVGSQAKQKSVQVKVENRDHLNQVINIVEKQEQEIQQIDSVKQETQQVNPVKIPDESTVSLTNETLKAEIKDFLKVKRHLSDDRIEEVWKFLEQKVFADHLFYRMDGDVSQDYLFYWKNNLKNGIQSSDPEVDAFSYFARMSEMAENPAFKESVRLGKFLREEWELARKNKEFRIISDKKYGDQELLVPSQGSLSASWIASIDFELVGISLQDSYAVDLRGILNLDDLIQVEYLMRVMKDREFQTNPRGYVQKLESKKPLVYLEPAPSNQGIDSAEAWLMRLNRFRTQELLELADRAKAKYPR